MSSERRTASIPGVVAVRLPELDSIAPMDAAERLRDLPGLALLESARPGRNARWTYLTADPVTVLEAPADNPDPLVTARQVLGRLAPGSLDDPNGPRFLGGLVGYLSYDLGRRLERIPEHAIADQELPLLRLALHDWVVAWDRRLGQAWLSGRAVDERIDALDRRLADIRARLVPAIGAAGTPAPSAAAPPATFEFRSGLSRAAYEAGVDAVRAEIAHGDIYQANLAR
ncbi:MAG: hypothetical protein ABIV26_09300, partial [Candidatus Limnocylindrales bacterium]